MERDGEYNGQKELAIGPWKTIRAHKSGGPSAASDVAAATERGYLLLQAEAWD